MIFLYQAYGRKDVIDQVKVSAASLVKHLDINDKIVIYTDQKAELEIFFNDSKVHLVGFDQETLKKWRGEINFVHRVKLEIILDTLSRFSDDLFYLDGDTIFLKSPERLKNEVKSDRFVMHICEGKLKEERDPLAKKLHRFLKGKKYQLDGKEISIDGDIAVWNAGVIGLPKQFASTLIGDALDLTDQLYKQYAKHTMEQLAVSYVLQKTGIIMPADEEVLHYWYGKEEAQARIDQFLVENKNFQDCISKIEGFQIPTQKPKKKPKLSFLKKIFSIGNQAQT